MSARGSGTTRHGSGRTNAAAPLDEPGGVGVCRRSTAGHVGVVNSRTNRSPESLQKCRMKYFRVFSTAACCSESILFHFGCTWGVSVGVRSTPNVPAQVFCMPNLFYLFLTSNERWSKTPNKHSSYGPMLPGGCVCCHVRSNNSHKFSLPIFLCKSLGKLAAKCLA